MSTCPFCWHNIKAEVIEENDLCAYIPTPGDVLKGAGMIIPKAHRQTVFDLTEEEALDTLWLLYKIKAKLDKDLNPDGYNIGWNCYTTAGQTVHHAHLHVIPRFKDESLAGKGIRHHLKQATNKRPHSPESKNEPGTKMDSKNEPGTKMETK